MAGAKTLAAIGKVLSAEVRVRIIELLRGRVLCVGALSARLGVTQGAVSQHLRVLRTAGLVAAEKRGYFVHYRLNHKTFSKWKDLTDRFLAAAAAQPPEGRKCGRERSKRCALRKTSPSVSTPRS